MSDEKFHGYRYLVDAETLREYAMRFDNGQPAPPIQVFSGDASLPSLKPGQTVFAFDDESEIEYRPDANGRNVGYLGALLWKMTANDAGKIDKGGQLNNQWVEYKISPVVLQTGDVRVKYTLTEESKQELAARDITGAPESFEDLLPATDPAIKRGPNGVSVDQRALAALAFPPHHSGPAAVARHNIEISTVRPNVLPTPAPANGNAAPRPTDTFARVTTPAPRVARTLDKPKVADSTIEALIKQFCIDLSDKAAQGRLDPVIGRDAETDQALRVMARRKQASLCFTGDAGVGKTAMFAALAQRINDDPDLPEEFRNARILQLDLQAMNAGAQFRGQFEAKLKPLIDGLQEREGWLKGRKIILAIDEIHSQLTAGMASGGTDSGNMMKPFLTSPGISVLGTTTAEEYRKHIEKDPAMVSRFEQLVIGEPSTADTMKILKGLWPTIREHHQLTEDLSDKDFQYVVTMTTRYAPNDSNPRKGEKVLDMAGASAKFRRSGSITREDINRAVAQMSKLSPEFLAQGDAQRFLAMEKDLPSRVLGQDPAIRKVVDGLIGARSGLNDPNQPWGCFVLQGPTGTGKTELCKELSKYLFGTEEAMIKLDMSEYSAEHTVSRLIGAPPGYVGFDSASPALTERIRQRPYSILLLDEIEKAHPKVFDVFLSILNDGKMTDNQGKTVLFNNVIIMMTTNLGAKNAMGVITGNEGVTFGQVRKLETDEQRHARLTSAYAGARGDFFRPEMINRIEELGGFVTFAPLSEPVIASLIDREIGKVGDRLSQNLANYTPEDGSAPVASDAPFAITLDVSDDIRAKLTKDGYNPTMGARPMRKVIREQIGNPLGKWLMANRDELVAFAAKHGTARLVIDKVGADFAPVIAAPVALPAAAPVGNDNKPARKPKKATAPKV